MSKQITIGFKLKLPRIRINTIIYKQLYRYRIISTFIIILHTVKLTQCIIQSYYIIIKAYNLQRSLFTCLHTENINDKPLVGKKLQIKIQLRRSHKKLWIFRQPTEKHKYFVDCTLVLVSIECTYFQPPHEEFQILYACSASVPVIWHRMK